MISSIATPINANESAPEDQCEKKLLSVLMMGSPNSGLA